MGDMRRKTLPILALFTGLALIAHPLLWAQAPEAVQLTYKFAPGTAVKYRISQQLTGTRRLPGASMPSPIDAELVSIIRVRCVQAFADGSLNLEISTETANLKMGGKPVTGYQPPKEARKIWITPIGKVFGPAGQGSGGQQRSPLDFGSIESIVLTAILPDKPVSIGGTWAAELPLPFSAASKLKLGFSLEKLELTPSGRAARIKQVLSTPINPDASGGSNGARGSQEGQADLLFSIDRGILLSARGAIKSTVAVPMAAPMMPGESGNQQPQDNVATVVLDSKFTVELLPEGQGASGSAGK